MRTGIHRTRTPTPGKGAVGGAGGLQAYRATVLSWVPPPAAGEQCSPLQGVVGQATHSDFVTTPADNQWCSHRRRGKPDNLPQSPNRDIVSQDFCCSPLQEVMGTYIHRTRAPTPGKRAAGNSIERV